MSRFIFVFFMLLFTQSCVRSVRDVLVEAESFADKGGWLVDTQSIPQMGSAYLIAHGMGEPVVNASTNFSAPSKGRYRMWVRTRDWARPWSRDESPGKFRIKVNGTVAGPVFGVEKGVWHWQDGGHVNLQKGRNSLELQDMTGFDGRCDAVYFTMEPGACPPDDKGRLESFRKNRPGLGRKPAKAGVYDLVVVGGGIAGCCAAVSAARLGCKVALVQNRPVLGGNNSSEVRVGLSGLIMQQPYENLGKLNDELGGVGYWNNEEARRNPQNERSRQILSILERHPEKLIHNAGPASNYDDNKKLALIKSHDNIDLFLNTQVVGVVKKGDCIASVIGRHVETGKEYKLCGDMFCDCTGDGDLGYMAGADFRMGRESRAETGEPRAPERPDSLVMGTSVQWYSEESDKASDFPECPWAIAFDAKTCVPLLKGDWNWETGLDKNQITQIEEIRDHALRAVYGNWSFLKNDGIYRNRYAKRKLAWVAFIGGKRESRRLLGDVILKEQDIVNRVVYDDASFVTTWGIDLHYPKEIKGLDEPPFLAFSDSREIKPYPVPYRCLYSRNVSNLFMAGRDISVTHVALGSIRVMRTCGMMGEVVGMAASLCKKYKTDPRGVYETHLDDLKRLMEKGVGKAGFEER